MRNKSLRGLILITLLTLVAILTSPHVLSSTNSSKCKVIDDKRLVSDRIYYNLVRLLKISGAVYPSFSPDSKYLLFTSSVSGEPQLWRYDLRTGEASQLTFFNEGVSYGYWLPNNWIAFSKDIGGNERDQVILLSSDAKTIRKLTSDPKAIHRFTAVSRNGRYIAIYSNERDPKYFDVYIYDFKEDKLRRVLALDTFLIPLEFSPKGDKLVVTEYLSNVEQKLIMLDLRANTWRYLNLPPSEYSSISWLPGEEAFLFVTDLNEEYPYIARYDLRTGKWKKVYNDLKNVEELKVSPDGRFIAVSVNWNGYSKLYLIDRLTSKRELIPVPKGVIYSLEFSRDGKYLAINLSRSTYPASIYLYDLNKGKLMLTVKPNLNGFTESDFVEPKLVFYKSFDGEKIPAFLYLPKEIKGKVPCIIWYHGGPEGQARPNFSTFAQLMTSLGFAVLRPNIRGSSGYGKSWLEADNVRNRWVSLKDGYWANLYVRSLDFIDKDRIYAYGGSYGGYMVMAELTFWPDAWRAGIEVVGISDMISFLEKTGPWRRKLRVSEYGDPEKDREFLIEVSPYYHAERIKAPLLVIHGKNDPRVPVEQAYKIVNRLKELNKPVEAMIFEDEGHGVGKFQNRLKVYLRILRFLGITER